MLKQHFLLAKVLVILLATNLTHAISQENKEINRLETLFNLSRFIDWSPNKSFNTDEKVLYILSDKKTCEKYKNISKNLSKIQNWELVFTDKMVNFKEGSLVFVTKNKEDFCTEIIRFSNKKNIITIAEKSDDFCNKGGMINIGEKDGQTKFEINYRIIQDKSLDISSKLLALSKIYE